MTIPGKLPLVLVIAEQSTDGHDMPLADLLAELCPDRFRLVHWTMMDACLRMLPPDYALAVLDTGLLEPLHREVLEKLLAEGGRPVIAHLSDGRPETVAFLGGLPGVSRIRKPASLHELAAAMDQLLEKNPPGDR